MNSRDIVKPEGYFHVVNSPRSVSDYPEGFTVEMAERSIETILRVKRVNRRIVDVAAVRRKGKAGSVKE